MDTKSELLALLTETAKNGGGVVTVFDSRDKPTSLALPYNIIFRDNGVETDRLQAASKRGAIKKALRLSGLPTFGPLATLLDAGEQVTIDDCETVEVSRN